MWLGKRKSILTLGDTGIYDCVFPSRSSKLLKWFGKFQIVYVPTIINSSVKAFGDFLCDATKDKRGATVLV